MQDLCFYHEAHEELEEKIKENVIGEIVILFCVFFICGV